MGTLVWGNNAKDNADPVRVEKAFPATVTKAQFDRVNRIMRSRAPRVSHPRRVGSTFLLSGLVKCYRCKRALSGRYSSRGTFPYYVCHSFVKRAPGSCDSPRVDARKFEELVVGLIRSNILTEGNIRSLVNVVDEQMDDVAGEERKRLETIESELADVRGRLGRLYDLVETTTEFNMADFAHRIRDHKERQERLESAAEGARAILAQRRAVLDDVKTITAYAQDMNRFLQKSELTERRAFIETFVREIELLPDNAVVRYTIPISQSTSKTAVLVGGGPGQNWRRQDFKLGLPVPSWERSRRDLNPAQLLLHSRLSDRLHSIHIGRVGLDVVGVYVYRICRRGICDEHLLLRLPLRASAVSGSP